MAATSYVIKGIKTLASVMPGRFKVHALNFIVIFYVFYSAQIPSENVKHDLNSIVILYVFYSAQVPSENVIGIANFFLSAGILGSSEDTYYVLDALSALEANR